VTRYFRRYFSTVSPFDAGAIVLAVVQSPAPLERKKAKAAAAAAFEPVLFNEDKELVPAATTQDEESEESDYDLRRAACPAINRVCGSAELR
jgi:hypothetical protein